MVLYCVSTSPSNGNGRNLTKKQDYIRNSGTKIDTTIVFFGTLIYVIAIFVGFFIISELRETNKNFKKILRLLSHSAFLAASKDSSNVQARKMHYNAFEILSAEFPDEVRKIAETQSCMPDSAPRKRKHEEFEGLPLNDLM
ncbi:hypothetical protein MJD09_12405 [bacterium]|nr:hypothetical protein [bacterium]